MNILWMPLTLAHMTLGTATGQVDAWYISRIADSLGVPPIVALAVSWQESRSGRKGNDYLGPGKVVADTIIGLDGVISAIHTRRVCRELGRFQINPCTWKSRDPRCTLQLVKTRYANNVYCGVKNVLWKYKVCGNWYCAVTGHNGSGPMAEAYGVRASQYIGRITLLTL